MGGQSVYVFPTREEAGFCGRVIQVLAGAGVLERPTEAPEDESEYAAGARVESMIPGGFQYLGVRIGERPRLIPEDPAIDPRCPSCGADRVHVRPRAQGEESSNGPSATRRGR